MIVTLSVNDSLVLRWLVCGILFEGGAIWGLPVRNPIVDQSNYLAYQDHGL